MIYLILFGLDFYEKFHALLFTVTLILSVIMLLALTIYLILRQDVKDNSVDDTVMSVWDMVLKTLKLKKLTIFLVCFTILIPSPKTVTIVTGLYAGEQVVTYIQDSPLAKKAYQLAEKKIDELLEETQTKDKK